MKEIFLFFPLLFVYQTLLADMCTMTVVAESGLSIREEPNLTSKRLGVVKFGETVSGYGPCESLYESVLWGDYVEVDNIRGKWVQISYNGKKGYMFSGYLVVGDIFPYSRNDTIDNVIIDEIYEYGDEGGYKIDSFDYRFYTPNLNWYGIIIKQGAASISPTKIKPTYNNDRWLKENLYEQPVVLEVENGNKYDFLFGTKKELNHQQFETTYHQSCTNEIGKFIYPEEKYLIEFNKRSYIFKAYEILTIDNKANNKIKREYTLSLYFWKKEVKIENKKNVLNLYGDGELNAIYQNPKLYWTADLNQDGFLDFVFEVSPMADKCGAFPYLKFLYSIVDKNGNLSYRANNDVFEFDNYKKE